MPICREESASKLRLVDHQPLIGDAWINDFPRPFFAVPFLHLIPHFIYEALPGREAALHSGGEPLLVYKLHHGMDPARRCPFPGLRALPHHYAK